MNTTTTPILVTGATGYIASWVIKNLLEQGCTVHATVRDLNKKKEFCPFRKNCFAKLRFTATFPSQLT